jgi:hypothetical protein
MKRPLTLVAGLLIMWGLAMVAVPEVPHVPTQTTENPSMTE